MMTLLASEVKIEQDGSREQEEEDDRRMYQQQQRHHHITQPAEFGSGGPVRSANETLLLVTICFDRPKEFASRPFLLQRDKFPPAGSVCDDTLLSPDCPNFYFTPC
jgi:hypothetical protein